jgi:hypothetical protein
MAEAARTVHDGQDQQPLRREINRRQRVVSDDWHRRCGKDRRRTNPQVLACPRPSKQARARVSASLAPPRLTEPASQRASVPAGRSWHTEVEGPPLAEQPRAALLAALLAALPPGAVIIVTVRHSADRALPLRLTAGLLLPAERAAAGRASVHGADGAAGRLLRQRPPRAAAAATCPVLHHLAVHDPDHRRQLAQAPAGAASARRVQPGLDIFPKGWVSKDSILPICGCTVHGGWQVRSIISSTMMVRWYAASTVP